MANDLTWCTDEELTALELRYAKAMLTAEDTYADEAFSARLANIRAEQSRRRRPKRASLLRRLFG